MHKLNLEPGEEILLTVRKHQIVYWVDGFVLLVLFILPYAAYSFLGLAVSFALSEAHYHLVVFCYSAWFALLWAYFFIVWTNIYLDAWVVTNRRIIDIEQISLFHRDMTDFRHERIQDVTVEERGILSNILHYGNLHVQTAGESRSLRIDTIPNPQKVRDLIAHCHDEVLNKMQSHTDPSGD